MNTTNLGQIWGQLFWALDEVGRRIEHRCKPLVALEDPSILEKVPEVTRGERHLQLPVRAGCSASAPDRLRLFTMSMIWPNGVHGMRENITQRCTKLLSFGFLRLGRITRPRYSLLRFRCPSSLGSVHRNKAVWTLAVAEGPELKEAAWEKP